MLLWGPSYPPKRATYNWYSYSKLHILQKWRKWLWFQKEMTQKHQTSERVGHQWGETTRQITGNYRIVTASPREQNHTHTGENITFPCNTYVVGTNSEYWIYLSAANLLKDGLLTLECAPTGEFTLLLRFMLRKGEMPGEWLDKVSLDGILLLLLMWLIPGVSASCWVIDE